MVKINSFRSGFSSLERREFSAREDAKCSSFFVREKRKKGDRAPPFARTRVCALLRVKNILSRNILADRVTGGLPQESSERAFLFPSLPSPPFPTLQLRYTCPSFLSSFLPSFPFFLSSFLPTVPSPAQQKPNKDARPFEKIDFARRSTEPRHAANVVLDAVKGGKEGESLLGDSFERE